MRSLLRKLFGDKTANEPDVSEPVPQEPPPVAVRDETYQVDEVNYVAPVQANDSNSRIKVHHVLYTKPTKPGNPLGVDGPIAKGTEARIMRKSAGFPDKLDMTSRNIFLNKPDIMSILADGRREMSRHAFIYQPIIDQDGKTYFSFHRFTSRAEGGVLNPSRGSSHSASILFEGDWDPAMIPYAAKLLLTEHETFRIKAEEVYQGIVKDRENGMGHMGCPLDGDKPEYDSNLLPHCTVQEIVDEVGDMREYVGQDGESLHTAAIKISDQLREHDTEGELWRFPMAFGLGTARLVASPLFKLNPSDSGSVSKALGTIENASADQMVLQYHNVTETDHLQGRDEYRRYPEVKETKFAYFGPSSSDSRTVQPPVGKSVQQLDSI